MDWIWKKLYKFSTVGMHNFFLLPTQTSPQQIRKHGGTKDLGAIEKYLICKSIVVIGMASGSPIPRIKDLEWLPWLRQCVCVCTFVAYFLALKAHLKCKILAEPCICTQHICFFAAESFQLCKNGLDQTFSHALCENKVNNESYLAQPRGALSRRQPFRIILRPA